MELMDQSGRTLAKARLPEGVAGIARLHAMIGKELRRGRRGRDDWVGQVGIETDRGLWAQALVAAGYGCSRSTRCRPPVTGNDSVSGAKSDPADAHLLADMVRTKAHQLRPVARTATQAQAVKVVSRMHKTLIWERTRTMQRLRHALRDYFPAALEAFEDLDAGHPGAVGQGPRSGPAAR